MTFFILLPIALLLLVRRFHVRHMQGIERSLDSCECMAIQKRAEKMHAAVDSKIRAMDSRDPDEPLHGPHKREEPPTVEMPSLPPLDDCDRGATRISVVIVLLLLLGSFLVGFQTGGHVREKVLQSREGVIKSTSVAKSAPKSFDERLTDLRQHPTLLTIGWFERTQVVPERRREVAVVLETIADSDNQDNVRAAVAALGKWGTPESVPVVQAVFVRERGQTRRYAELALAQLK